MGDLIHALPAITDAKRTIPNISFDWVIEKNFSEIALWHPAVTNIIKTSHRHWKKNAIESWKDGEIPHFLNALRQKNYDAIIDGQTNIKSAVVTRLAKGPKHGLDRRSAREWLAPLAYQHHYLVDKDMHAITRLRLLFSQALKYPCPETAPDFNIIDYPFPELKFSLPKRYLMFVHNASWPSKMWPENYWQQLINLATQDNYSVVLPWGTQAEKERAERICNQHQQVIVLPFCNLSEQARILKMSSGAICSDTGLSHLAAALNVPAVTLYGSTSAKLIGATGLNQKHFISPFKCTECYKVQCHFDNKIQSEPLCQLVMTPNKVWECFKNLSS